MTLGPAAFESVREVGLLVAGLHLDQREERRPPRTSPLALPYGASLAATGALAALVLSVAVGAGPAIRVPLALLVILFVPGTAFVGLTRLQRSAALATLVIAVSLATTLVAATLLVSFAALTPKSMTAVLALVCGPGLFVQLRRARPGFAKISLRIGRGDAATSRVIPVLTVVSAALWLLSLPHIHPGNVNSVGLVSVLPVMWWLGLACLVISIAAQFHLPFNRATIATSVALLILILHGTAASVEHYAREPTGYTHVGLIGYIVRDHAITQIFDARYAWPGSLNLGAALTQLSGLSSAVTFLKWAPTFFNALYALAIYAMARTFVRSERAAWMSVAIFSSLSWVGQDYFAPQALNFFFFIAAVAIVVSWIPVRVRRRGIESTAPARFGLPTPLDRVGVVLAVLLLAGASAMSHQLTPFFFLSAIVVLATVGRRDLGLVPVLVLLLIVMWVSWGAIAFWSGHLGTLTRGVGDVGGTVNAGVGERFAGSDAGRTAVLVTRVGLSVGALGAAFYGFVRMLRARRPQWALAALTLCPIPAAALQSYGGEMPLRIFFFGLPFAATLIAANVERHEPSTRRFVCFALVALAAVGAFTVARYGNERFEQVFPEDIAATRAMYRAAAPDDVVITVNPANPLRVGEFHSLKLRNVADLAYPDVIDPIRSLEKEGIRRAYVVITKGQVGWAILRHGSPPNWDRLLGDRLLSSGKARLIFREGQAAVYRVVLSS